jgi:3-hydroxybutyryl-CoA dehydrogenase
MADLLLEAIVEEFAAKQALFGQLSRLNGEAAIYATNTSSLSVAAIAETTPFPHRMAGMHFFNPAPIMKLVEVVQTAKSDAYVVQQLLSLSRKCGKVPVLCQDAPGFIVNHVARPFYLEALRLLEAGIADTATIDQLMMASGFKMGPFHLMDLIGNDINYAVSQSVYEAMGRPPRLRPSPLQEKAVREGRLGKKTGKGYYDYGAEQTI